MADVQPEFQEQYCAVCLQMYDHPTKLPCGHIFCFLCTKGIALQNKTCAMCRSVIPNDYLNKPVLLSYNKNIEENRNQDYQWYYEGGNGWWKYDKRSNSYLEELYNKGEKEGSLLLAGYLYRIDFDKNIQVRVSDPTKKRKIRRDTPFLPAKGIAGIDLSSSIENLESPAEVQVLDNTERDEEVDTSVEIIDENSADEDSFSEMVRNLRPYS
ncbi:PREDICTED: E3 ubiquitin-protein ligase rnf146 isoform X2 [Papilio polytes]|uniref:E3 ubiquitin-protein ligase rnf146 isoform X2 n=1 Tax=Papilio polytes TaxID=76194 RepID=UPI000675F4A1|nr:PREDICTED: E3 ubiquitin-protein ligase rnf146 isoform X2 [Papilio polytes]